MKKIRIYKIVRNDEVIYIGQTKQHLYDRFLGKYKFDTYDCDIELIEETEDISRERYWIQYYLDLGCNLYNKNKGYTGLTKAEQMRKKRNSNPELTKEYNKIWYENNKEKLKEYREKNKEHKKEYDKIKKKEYNKKNREKINAYYKEYNKKNREKINAYYREYNKKKKDLREE